MKIDGKKIAREVKWVEKRDRGRKTISELAFLMLNSVRSKF